MDKKTIIIFLLTGLFFYFLGIVQISFLPFFKFFALQWNFSVIIALLVCVLEESQKLLGIFCAFWAGLFLDLFSGSAFFGLFTVSFLFMAVIIKLVLYKYVKLPPWQWLSKIQS